MAEISQGFAKDYVMKEKYIILSLKNVFVNKYTKGMKYLGNVNKKLK